MENNQLTAEIIKKAVLPLGKNSHKGQNGKVLIIGGSPLFHGAGRLSAKASCEVLETIVSFSSRTNDMVFFCSTEENLNIVKSKQECFIGIRREQVSNYIPTSDAILVGPGMMREKDIGFPATDNEQEITKNMTNLVLDSGKKCVLDAGSLQVIKPGALKGKDKVIITPHSKELKMLFGIDTEDTFLGAESNLEQITKVAQIISTIAKEYGIVLVLKGPVDLIVGPRYWFYSPGGSPGMTKGGTGDILAGVITALYSRTDDPLIAACAGSFLLKRAGEEIEKKQDWFFNSTDLAEEISKTLSKILSNSV